MLLALLVGSTSIAFGRIAYPFLRNGICSLWIGGSSLSVCSFMLIYGPLLFELIFDRLTAHHGDLPIGLPNNSNLCYLNALLQAMSSSRILVKSLRHSAAVKRDRLLCSLVAVLEGYCFAASFSEFANTNTHCFIQLFLQILGLGCSFDYLKRHNLIEAILIAHRTLIDELSLTGKWTVNDQQVRIVWLSYLFMFWIFNLMCSRHFLSARICLTYFK